MSVTRGTISRGSGLGSLFGGDSGMGITKTRRGLERTLFQITIILGALFLVLNRRRRRGTPESSGLS